MRRRGFLGVLAGFLGLSLASADQFDSAEDLKHLEHPDMLCPVYWHTKLNTFYYYNKSSNTWSEAKSNN